MTADGSLKTITSVPGVRHALVLSRDGLPHTRSEGLSPNAADLLAAACSGLYSLATSVAIEHGAGDKAIRQQTIEYAGGFLFLREAGPNGRLAVLTGAGIDRGILTQRMTALAKQLSDRALPTSRPA